jgi:hypothetical protein
MAHALFTYNSAGVEFIRALNHYRYAIEKKKKWFQRGAFKEGQDPLKVLRNKVLATTFDREIALTRTGLWEFEEVSKEFEELGDDTVKMPKTAHELVAWCFERDPEQEEMKAKKFLLKEHKLVRETGRFLGDPVRTAEALAAEAYAGDREKKSAEAPAPAAAEVPSVPASEAEVNSPLTKDRASGDSKNPSAAPATDIYALDIYALAGKVLDTLKGKKREMYRDQLFQSIEDLKKAWKHVREAVRNARITKEQFTQVAEKLLRERQVERDKRLYDIRMENYASRGSAFMGAVVQAAYESKGWLISEWNCRESFNQSPAMFEKGIQRFSQLNDVSGLTYLGLHSTDKSLVSKTELQRVLKCWNGDADGDESLKSSMKKKMAAALGAAEKPSPFEIWRYGSEKPIDLETYARPTFQDAPPAYPYEKISTAVGGEVKELREKWPRRDCAMRLRKSNGTPLSGDNKEAYDDLDHLCEILRAELSPYCTHMIFFRHEADKIAFSRYLWRLLPHATTVMLRAA